MKTSHIVYGGTSNPPSKEPVAIDGSVRNSSSLADYFPEKDEDKNSIREIADWMKVVVRDKKSNDLIDCVISKPGSRGGTNCFLIGFSKTRTEGARGPISKFGTPTECAGKFISIQDAQQALRNWIENPTSNIERVDHERKYRTWASS